MTIDYDNANLSGSKDDIPEEPQRSPRRRNAIIALVASSALLVAMITAAIVAYSASLTLTIPEHPVPYREIHGAATLADEAISVFDEIVNASVTAQTPVTAFLPWENADHCESTVFRSATTTQDPNQPGPYLGSGVVLLRVDFPAENSTRVRFYECTPK